MIKILVIRMTIYTWLIQIHRNPGNPSANTRVNTQLLSAWQVVSVKTNETIWMAQTGSSTTCPHKLDVTTFREQSFYNQYWMSGNQSRLICRNQDRSRLDDIFERKSVAVGRLAIASYSLLILFLLTMILFKLFTCLCPNCCISNLYHNLIND